MDYIIKALYGLSDEDKMNYIYKSYNMLYKQLPYSFPEIYGMTEKEILNEIEILDNQKANILNALGGKSNVISPSISTYASQLSNNGVSDGVGSIALSIKDKLRHLKEFKVKGPPNPNPGKVRPPGQSAHPGRNRRNRAHRKRAKLNQTRVKTLLADAALMGFVFGAVEGLITQYINNNKSKELVEKIKKMSKGFKDRLLLDIPFDDDEYKEWFKGCDDINEKISLFDCIYDCYIIDDDNDEKNNRIIKKYDLDTGLSKYVYKSIEKGTVGSVDSLGKILAAVGIGKGIQAVTKASVRSLSGQLLITGSVALDGCKSIYNYYNGKNGKEAASEFASNTAYNLLGSAAMIGTSLITGGVFIPLAASIGATYAASSLSSMKKENEVKEKYINGRIETVKEAFEKTYEYEKNEDLPIWLGCNEAYLLGDQVKSFLEDIYFCDSDDIITLRNNYLYRWSDIENAVREYEKGELENLKTFKDELEDHLFILCSLLDYNNLRLLLLDWDINYPSELEGELLCLKCSHDIRKRFDYFNRHYDELEELPPSQLKRMYDDICSYENENIRELKEQLQYLL